MAVYNSSVVLRCLHGDDVACEVIFSDENCIIPPTTKEEIKYDWNYEGRKEVERHCKVYTYNDPPFNDFDVRNQIEEFVWHIDRNYLRATPRGRRARVVRAFQRKCQASGKLEHRLNDYRILKEANVLAELGVKGADVLISADRAHTDEFCCYIYEHVMEEELPIPYKEEMLVKTKYYRDVWKELTKPVIRVPD